MNMPYDTKLWKSAYENVKFCKADAEEAARKSDTPWAMSFYIAMCDSLIDRYESGERNIGLYEEMDSMS